MSTAKVSIIIPVYNTAEYLDYCMKSVLGQTERDIEVVLVDDGSTDGISPKMCDDYGKRDGRVKVIHKENGGLITTWIRGTKEASAPYVCYLDSDDWVDTDMIESLYKLTSQYKIDKGALDEGSPAGVPENMAELVDYEIISSNYIVEKASERRKETQGLTPGEYTGAKLDEVRTRLLGEEVRPVTMSRCMKLISRKLVLDNIKYCNHKIKMSEDVNITLPCLCDCKRLVIFDGGYFYHYRLVSDSMAHGYDPKLLENLDLTDETFRYILDEKGIGNGAKQLDREYIRILFVVLKNELRCQDKDTVKRVRDIFLRTDIKKRIDETSIEVSSKANKLLYTCMKHPSGLMISVTKAILGAYDRKTN